MRRRSDYTYTPDPATVDMPVTTDEVDRLLDSVKGGNSSLTNRRALEHLLRRFEVTLDAGHDQIRRLHQEVSRGHLENNRAQGAATTLHPADSFRFLSVEEQKGVVDGHLREKLTAIAAEERRVKDERAALVRAGSQLKWAVGQLLADPSAPGEFRVRLTQLLELAEKTGADLGQTAPTQAGPALGAAPAPPDADDLNDLLSADTDPSQAPR